MAEKDTSLDDFLDAGAESPESPNEGAVDEDAADGVEPAVTTFAWSPGEDVCALCGDQVRERWGTEEDLVCGECKEWTALDR